MSWNYENLDFMKILLFIVDFKGNIISEYNDMRVGKW